MRELFVTKKNQQFEIGRVIELQKCIGCQKCGTGSKAFMECSNYCPQKEKKIYTPTEWYKLKKEEDGGKGLRVPTDEKGMFENDETLEDFMTSCIRFPKGISWKIVHPYRGGERVPLRVDFCRPSRPKERGAYGDFYPESCVYMGSLKSFMTKWNGPKRYGILSIKVEEKLRELKACLEADEVKNDNA